MLPNRGYLGEYILDNVTCKETKPVNPNGNQPLMFIRRTDAAAEAPIFWPPDMKSWLIGWCWWRPWCWERSKAKGEGDDRGGDGSIADSMDKNLSKLQDIMEDRGACCATAHGATKSWMWLHPGLPHCRQILYQLSHKESPRILEWITHPFFSGSSWPRNLTGLLHYRQILYQPSYLGSPILAINHILILTNYIGLLWWLRRNLPEEAWQPTPVFLPGESPWTEECGGLQTMVSQRVRHDWARNIIYMY